MDFDGLRDRPFPKLTEKKKTIVRSGLEIAHSDLQSFCSEYVPEVECNRKSTLKKYYSKSCSRTDGIPQFDLLTEIRKKTTSAVCKFSEVFSSFLCPPRSLSIIFFSVNVFLCVSWLWGRVTFAFVVFLSLGRLFPCPAQFSNSSDSLTNSFRRFWILSIPHSIEILFFPFVVHWKLCDCCRSPSMFGQ